jgi:isoquinoline 1-oxidoreductase beta subunit
MNAVNRRSFLRLVTLTGGGLALGLALPGCLTGPKPWPNAQDGSFQPNAFLQLRPDGRIVLAVHKSEMGQGVSTGFATLVAEELEVDPLSIEIVFAEPHPDYKDPEFSMMITGGSASLKSSWMPLREAAATMRQMLVQAAATGWGVAVTDCVVEDGAVRLRDGTKRASYAELAEPAAKLPLPATPAPLKSANDWRLIGKFDTRVDAREKVDGSALFALDVQLPGMLTAVLLRCPHFGGSLKRFDGAKATASPGVRQVFACADGVAVVADGYWNARQGAALVEVEWDKGPQAGLDSAAIAERQAKILDEGGGRVLRESGTRAKTAVARTVEAEYRVPFLAHATMEPMNAVAQVQGDSAEIWAGNQAPDVLQGLVARALGIPAANVKVNTTLLGGGFGRRAMLDFAVEAALIAQAAGAATDAAPVKLVWSREDDMHHDWYRPTALARSRAEIDAEGNILSWEQGVTAASIMAQMMPVLGISMLPQWVPEGVMTPVAALIGSRDDAIGEGVAELPYELPYIRVEAQHSDTGVPVGVWRSVGHSQNGFFAESFVDEVAHAVGEDPLAFRMQRLPKDSRHARVLARVAEAAGWGKPAAGRFQGLALHESFDSVVGEVVEVSLTNGRARIERVVCAIDCGIAVNPDVVRMQAESAIVYALSAALHGKITINDGAVVQSNFDDYPVLRMNECPAIEVHILPSEASPTGIGEPPTPPLAPALANALFAATGRRQRELPLALA